MLAALLLLLALAVSCAAFAIDRPTSLDELHLPAYPDVGLHTPPPPAAERSQRVQYPAEPEVEGSATFKLQDAQHIDADAAYHAALEADTGAFSSSSHHSMHTMQAGSDSEWTMELMTAMAPFSHRIQPGFVYRQRPLTYRQVASNLTLTVKPGYLLLYEGAMTTNYMGVNYIEYDQPQLSSSRAKLLASLPDPAAVSLVSHRVSLFVFPQERRLVQQR